MRKVSFKLFQDERGTVCEMFLDYFDVWKKRKLRRKVTFVVGFL